MAKLQFLHQKYLPIKADDMKLEATTVMNET